MSSKLTSTKLPAMAAAFTAAVLVGISVIVTKLLVPVLGARAVGFLRYGTGVALLIGLNAVVSGKSAGGAKVKKSDLPLFFSVGLVAFCLFPSAYGAALKRIPASTGAILFSTTPLWSAIQAYIFRREKLHAIQIGGVLLALLGTAILTAPHGDAGKGDLFGKVLMLAAAFLMSLGGVMMKPLLSRYKTWTVTIYRMLFGAGIMLPVALITDGFFFAKLGTLSLNQLLGVAYLGIFGGAVCHIMWSVALAKLAATEVFVFLNLSPIIATILGVLVLGEQLHWPFYVAGIALLLGVMLSQVKPRAGKKAAVIAKSR